MQHSYLKLPTPVGILKLIASDIGLVAILWEKDNPKRVIPKAKPAPQHAILVNTASQLQAYFNGKRHHFDIPLDLQGTDFQKKVWSQLLKIPYGKTKSYLDIAKLIRRPTAARAVGMATGRNPISIIVPCHRVIGTNGKLTGFAGGLDIKRFLLTLEQVKSLSYS